MKSVLISSGWLARLCVCGTLSLVLLFSLLCVLLPHRLSITPNGHLGSHSSPSASPSAFYNTSDAWRALHFCKAAYCPQENVSQWACGSACANASANFHLFNVYDNVSTGNVGFSGMDHEDAKIVVAFRGTYNSANWIQDLDFWSMPYPHPGCGEQCTIHRGFYKAYDSMREQLIQDVLAMHAQYPHYSLFVTGHSLGGAIAVLCALEFTTWNLPRTTTTTTTSPNGGAGSLLSHEASPAKEPSPTHLMPVELYTFGEPRVGNVYFTNWSVTVLSMEQQYRITHARDPVPHLPPRSWGYLHVPQELWYPADDSIYLLCADRADAEDPNCSNSVYATTVSDHLMYLGTCTRCECPDAVMEEIYNYTLSPELRMLLAAEYLMDHPQSGKAPER